MLLNAAAVDLAFHSARVGLGGDGLMTNPALALNDRVQSSNEIIAAMRAAPKPVRITGETRDSVLRFVLTPINIDPEVERRIRIIRHNLGGTQPPLVDADAPDPAVVLVIAVEHLLRVPSASSREVA